MIATVVNVLAWVAAGCFAFYLIRDFIKVERQIKREEEERREARDE